MAGLAKIPEHIRRRRRFNPTPTVSFPPVDKITEPKFKQRLLSRFFVRFHMTLMLGAMMISGVSASKLLLELDVTRMSIRYSIAVCIAYGIFFISIKVWLKLPGFRLPSCWRWPLDSAGRRNITARRRRRPLRFSTSADRIESA